jgi:predicted permease
MATLWKDIRYAIRVLLKSPGFTAVVVLSLALGIGASTSIFSIVNAYLLRQMPVDQPDRLVAIYVTAPQWGSDVGNFSYPDLIDYRKQDAGLSDFMGASGVPLSMTDGAEPELIWGQITTGNYFSGLRVHMAAGRGFAPDEYRAPGEKPVCVLSYNFWRRRFQAAPNVAGRTIKINGHPFTIVGVAERGFIGATLFQFVPDVWVPVTMQQTIAPESGNFMEGRGNRWMDLRGRLKPGVTPKQAEAALNVVARELAKAYPQTNKDLTVHVIPGGARTQPWLAANGLITATTGIMAAVALLVLLIACVNAANLVLARSAARVREIAIRVALGAGRTRLVRQLLTESVLLSMAAGALGILIAIFFNDQLKGFYPTLDFQTADLDYETRLDPRLFPFALLVSLVTAVLFGLLPALRASRIDQVSAMKGAPTELDFGPVRMGRGSLLVMAQAALSCLLLILGGLFLRSMQFANHADPGFDRSGIIMFSVDLDLQRYDAARGRMFQQTLLSRLHNIAGVEDASIATPLPLDANNSSTLVLPEGYVPRSDQELNVAGVSRIGPHYFETMGTRIVAGRPMDERDSASSSLVAVVNETMARRYWETPERSIGRRFAPGQGQPLIEVIGVAKDGKYRTYGEGATPYYFSALAQDYQGRATILVRSKLHPDALMPAVRRQVSALDPALPIFGVRTMPQFLNRITSLYDLGASLVGTFAVIALLLAAVGIYGILHFTVARRTREIGIRIALGAGRAQVLRLVLQRSLLWVMVGISIGVGVALAVGQITGRLLAGVSGTDPVTFCAVILLFGLIAFLASVVPARRASRVDPIRALRYE